MSYTVLARKWRPRRFSEVLGQDHVTRSLKNAIASGRIAHAILLTGPRGVGKTSIARIFAKSLCCERGPTADPCDECRPCREIAEGSAIDVQEIDGASNRGVENVRELRESVKYTPASLRFKVYIIDEVHMLTTEAFNALLKTLEEPPDHVKFIFATTDVHKLPATILSRVQRYDLSRIHTRDIAAKLAEISASEKIEADGPALAAVARQSEGCMRDALTILDQLVAYTDGKIHESEVREALGLIDRNLVLDLARTVIAADPRACLEGLRQLDAQGADARRTVRELLGLLRDLVVLVTLEAPEKVIDAPEAELERMRAMVGGVQPETLHALFDLFLQSDQEIELASQPFLVFEMAVLKAAHLRPLLPISELLSRFADLEKGLPASPPPAPARAPGNVGGGSGKVKSVGPGAPRPSTPAPTRKASDTVPPISDEDISDNDDLDHALPEEAQEEHASSPWGRYLAHVGARAPLLASILAHGRFAGMDDTTLRVHFRVGLHGDMLGDKAALAAELAKECFGRQLKVIAVSAPAEGEVTPKKAVEARREVRERESDRERALKKEALEHEAIKQAKRILGGEIKEIKTFGA
ncbi:MAG: DNA polymerase III subunit gamma/tau [Deltaproteobacteria bacterium]|nr:DNA polymerase III subunit gamma/tau [Deltaproteobacteria bacterium]